MKDIDLFLAASVLGESDFVCFAHAGASVFDVAEVVVCFLGLFIALIGVDGDPLAGG